MSNSTMTIGEVAKHASMATEAIRFYEREGSLPTPTAQQVAAPAGEGGFVEYRGWGSRFRSISG